LVIARGLSENRGLSPIVVTDEKLLVKSADIAMYHAKKNGRDNVKMYQTGMQEIL